MANLNSILVVLTTACFGMASGIFFLLYCLEEPIYSPVLNKNTDGTESEPQMRRILMVLQQLLAFRVPVVMVTLITSGILSAASRVAICGFAPLPVLVIISSVLIFVVSAVSVPSAIKIFKSTSPEALSGEVQGALAPIVRLHRNVGILVIITLIIQLTSVAF
jgi:hypothetical protein